MHSKIEDLWTEFEQTGSVRSYLQYRGAAGAPSALRENAKDGSEEAEPQPAAAAPVQG